MIIEGLVQAAHPKKVSPVRKKNEVEVHFVTQDKSKSMDTRNFNPNYAVRPLIWVGYYPLAP